MTMPRWWSERRFGLFIDATPASVPGWAPIGAEAADYRLLLGESGATPSRGEPLVEVLAHHRDRWGHVEHFDEFVPLLTYERFDAEDWAQLVSDAGASYSILVAKHHDGWTWWDTPESSRPLTGDGPCRDVYGEFAAACERHGIALGATVSLDDRGGGPGTGADADDVLQIQVLDLLERQEPVLLCGLIHDVGADDRDRSVLLENLNAAAPDVVFDDGWPGSIDGPRHVVHTIRGRLPGGILEGPWQFVRGLGPSMGYNRAERDEHRLAGREIVALYTEVLAKGGNLVLAVGPDSAGVIPPEQAEPLRASGEWIRRFGSTLAATNPWSSWGDAAVRYLEKDGAVLAVDLTGAGAFAAFDPASWTVTAVEPVADLDTHLDWRQDSAGLHVERVVGSSALPETDGVQVTVYRVSIDVAARPNELFASTSSPPIALGPLVADAPSGRIVQLGEGVYEGPVRIPPGVIVRGLGPDRTTISLGVTPDAADDTSPSVDVDTAARLEHVRVIGRRRDGLTASRGNAAPAVVVVSGDAATLLGCTVSGIVAVRADDVLLRAVTASGIVGVSAERLHVSRCEVTGGPDELGIELHGGGGQLIESNRLTGHLSAIRLIETTGSNVRGNTISARWCGVHLDHCERAHVHGNRITWTMRAVDVDGGTQAIVDGNAVTDGDSGCIVEDGASDCEVYGNHWDRCRIGLLAWNAVAVHHQDNVASSLHEPGGALVTGP